MQSLRTFFSDKRRVIAFIALLLIGLTIPFTVMYLRSRQTLQSGASPKTCQIPIDFIFVVDLSNSMTTNDAEGKTRIQAVKDSLITFFNNSDIADSGGAHRFSFVTYNDDGRIISDFSTDVNAAKNIVNNLGSSQFPHRSGTRIDLGMIKALEQTQKPIRNVTILGRSYQAKRAVVLLTDGAQSEGSGKSVSELKIDVETRASQIRKSAYLATLGFGVDPASLDLALLQRIATQSPKLLYSHAKTNSELTAFFTSTIKSLVDCSCTYASSLEIIGEDGKVLTVPGFKTTSTVGGVTSSPSEVLTNGVSKTVFVTDELSDNLKDKTADVLLSTIPAGWEVVSSNCLENVSVAGVKTCGTPDATNKKLLEGFKFACGANVSYQYRVKKVETTCPYTSILEIVDADTNEVLSIPGFKVKRSLHDGTAIKDYEVFENGKSSLSYITQDLKADKNWNLLYTVKLDTLPAGYTVVRADCVDNSTVKGCSRVDPRDTSTFDGFLMVCGVDLKYRYYVRKAPTQALCVEKACKALDDNLKASNPDWVTLPSCALSEVGTNPDACLANVCEGTSDAAVCTSVSKIASRGKVSCDIAKGSQNNPDCVANKNVCDGDACVNVPANDRRFGNKACQTVAASAPECLNTKNYTYCEDEICKSGTYTGANPPSNATTCTTGSNDGCLKKNVCDNNNACVSQLCRRGERCDASVDECTSNPDCFSTRKTCKDQACVTVLGEGEDSCESTDDCLPDVPPPPTGLEGGTIASISIAILLLMFGAGLLFRK